MSSPRRESVLFVCTANQCRSPMAEALLRHELGEQATVRAESAGFLPGGSPCPSDVLKVMDEAGLDLSGHVSRQLSADIMDMATLVVTMTRQHLIDLAVEFPSDWERCFTVADLIERAESTGGRAANESLGSWVARLGEGRSRSDLIYLSAGGDVPDPIGRPVRQFRRVRDQLTDAVAKLAVLILQG